jgi:hypothetical protein
VSYGLGACWAPDRDNAVVAGGSHFTNKVNLPEASSGWPWYSSSELPQLQAAIDDPAQRAALLADNNIRSTPGGWETNLCKCYYGKRTGGVEDRTGPYGEGSVSFTCDAGVVYAVKSTAVFKQAKDDIISTESVLIKKLSADVKGNGKVKGAVYMDDNGKPGQLIATSEVATSSTTRGWVDMSFTESGRVHLGGHSEMYDFASRASFGDADRTKTDGTGLFLSGGTEEHPMPYWLALHTKTAITCFGFDNAQTQDTASSGVCPECAGMADASQKEQCYQSCLDMKYAKDQWTNPSAIFAGNGAVNTHDKVLAIHAVYARTDIQLSRLRSKMCFTITNCAECMESAEGAHETQSAGMTWAHLQEGWGETKAENACLFVQRTWCYDAEATASTIGSPEYKEPTVCAHTQQVLAPGAGVQQQEAVNTNAGSVASFDNGAVCLPRRLQSRFNLKLDTACAQHFSKLNYFNKYADKQCHGTSWAYAPAAGTYGKPAVTAKLSNGAEASDECVDPSCDVRYMATALTEKDCAAACLSAWAASPDVNGYGQHCMGFQLANSVCRLFTSVSHVSSKSASTCYSRKELGDLCAATVGQLVRATNGDVYYLSTEHEMLKVSDTQMTCDGKRVVPRDLEKALHCDGLKDPSCQSCISAAPKGVFTCEQYHIKRYTKCQLEGMAAGDLRCTGKRKIKILSANYGRLDSTTCVKSAQALETLECSAESELTIGVESAEESTYGRAVQCLPRLFAQDAEYSTTVTDCFNAATTMKVMQHLCEGRSECPSAVGGTDFFVNDFNFGNPCRDVYKYLDVSYMCERADDE